MVLAPAAGRAAARSSHTELPRLQALADHLRGVSTDEIFELELELIVSAISAAATVNRPSCSDAGQARSDVW
jgi:tartrate dehydratase alpha subunit/fumarate hydratase class I-like protein